MAKIDTNTVNPAQKSAKGGNNLMPKTRKSYFNNDIFRKKTKDAIESYQVYNSMSGNYKLTRAQIETLKFFAAPPERSDFKK